MLRRVLFWLGCTVLAGCLPFLLPVTVTLIRPGEPPPTLADLLGGGEALLVAVAWCAAGIGELRDTRPSRALGRSVLVWLCCGGLVVCSFWYGLLLAARTRDARETMAAYARWKRGEISTPPDPAGSPEWAAQRRAAAVWSLQVLAIAATVSCIAVAVGTPEVKPSC